MIAADHRLREINGFFTSTHFSSRVSPNRRQIAVAIRPHSITPSRNGPEEQEILLI
jgi:hypothetical protein